ncbi:MAG: chorismate-binding protein [Oligoflexia bacterium]|nr:chorismate-binding protein [Oligoflexia bacterium]
MEKGELKKAVPYAATGFNGELGFENKLFCIKNLILNHEPQNYLYFFSQNDQGFCGITPELLFSFKDHQFKTMALAGTAPVGISKEEFLNNKKEVSEHQYVVEFLRQKLSSLGDFNFSPMQVKAQGAIGHLLTLVEGELPQIDYFEIINLMHPTPALGGLPQNKALEFLKILNEELPRFHFGAPFGVVSSKEEALSVVLIRGLFWQKHSAFIGAGCGVVLESEFEKEWNELNLKINATKKNLGILN